MRIQDVKLAYDLDKSYRAATALLQQAEQLPEDRAINCEARLPDGLRVVIPIGKKTIIKDLLEQQATIAGKLTKMGVKFDEPADDPPAAQGEGLDAARG